MGESEMIKTIFEIAVSAFAVLGIYFSITALLQKWAFRACARMKIRSAGGDIPGKLLLTTDGTDLDNELRVCRTLVESGAFSGVIIDGGENTGEIIREVERMRRNCGRGTIEYSGHEGR